MIWLRNIQYKIPIINAISSYFSDQFTLNFRDAWLTGISLGSTKIIKGDPHAKYVESLESVHKHAISARAVEKAWQCVFLRGLALRHIITTRIGSVSLGSTLPQKIRQSTKLTRHRTLLLSS